MLFLLPAYLSENTSISHFSPVIREYIMQTDYFFVENEKTARKVIKFFAPEKKQSDLKLFLLDKYTENSDIKEAQDRMLNGQDFGLLSEAGLPCIADPGNLIVKWCHEKNIRVIPISGPSSIILALISSGFNGQEFTFQWISSDRKRGEEKENSIFRKRITENRLHADFHGNTLQK